MAAARVAGDARRLGLALVRCRAPVVNWSSAAPLVVTWISSPIHAEASSASTVMGTGVGMATLGAVV